MTNKAAIAAGIKKALEALRRVGIRPDQVIIVDVDGVTDPMIMNVDDLEFLFVAARGEA